MRKFPVVSIAGNMVAKNTVIVSLKIEGEIKQFPFNIDLNYRQGIVLNGERKLIGNIHGFALRPIKADIHFKDYNTATLLTTN